MRISMLDTFEPWKLTLEPLILPQYPWRLNLESWFFHWSLPTCGAQRLTLASSRLALEF
jgi:hypothetical protein